MVLQAMHACGPDLFLQLIAKNHSNDGFGINRCFQTYPLVSPSGLQRAFHGQHRSRCMELWLWSGLEVARHGSLHDLSDLEASSSPHSFVATLSSPKHLFLHV